MSRGLGHLICTPRNDKEKRDFKIVKCLTEICGHPGALFQLRRKQLLKWNGKVVARECVTTGSRSKSFDIRVVNGLKWLPEEVVELWSVRKFRGRQDCMDICFWRGNCTIIIVLLYFPMR